MSHLYPLATDQHGALSNAEHAALTRYDAERLAENAAVIALQTDWVSVPEAEIEAILAAAESGPGDGFVQRYENTDGTPVLAVTYWKLGAAKKTTAKPQKSAAKPQSDDEKPQDHTDDLYFRQGRTHKRKRKRHEPDPNQGDLFGNGE